jgi:hypothetical protein
LDTPPRIFISYARSDGEGFASALRQRLQAEHPSLTLWQDRADLEGGVGWWKQITDALDRVKILIMVMTLAVTQSPVAQKEWRHARQQGVRVCPVLGTGPAEYQALAGMLLDRSRMNPLAITTALQGAGGFGKTTLAAPLCHDHDIITAFDDGILWVTLARIRQVLDIVVDSPGRRAITASRDGSLRVWDLAAGRESAALQGDVDEVDTVAIAPNGRFAYSVVGDTVVASDLIALKPLRRLSLDHNITAIAVTPDGLHAALGDESGRVHFLTLDAGEPVPRHGGAIGNES